MADIKEVIAWLADTELYYQQEGSESYDSDHQCRMAHAAISVIEEQQAEIERLKENLDSLLPVLHGEWEDKEYSIGKCYAICSLCKKSSSGYANDTGFGFEYSFPNYCPHCGAKMKDGENDVTPGQKTTEQNENDN